jgi:hypothetical protein
MALNRDAGVVKRMLKKCHQGVGESRLLHKIVSLRSRLRRSHVHRYSK